MKSTEEHATHLSLYTLNVIEICLAHCWHSSNWFVPSAIRSIWIFPKSLWKPLDLFWQLRPRQSCPTLFSFRFRVEIHFSVNKDESSCWAMDTIVPAALTSSFDTLNKRTIQNINRLSLPTNHCVSQSIIIRLIPNYLPVSLYWSFHRESQQVLRNHAAGMPRTPSTLHISTASFLQP